MISWFKKKQRKKIDIEIGKAGVYRLEEGMFYILSFPFPMTEAMHDDLKQRLESKNIDALIIYNRVPKGLEKCKY